MPLPANIHKYMNHWFVETGSYIGDGIQQSLDAGFQQVKSIEIHEPLFNDVRKRFENNPRVELALGSSRSDLYDLIKNVNAPMTFWLDGHYSGHGTGFDGSYCPVMHELDQIARHHINTHTILIDDRRLFGRTDHQAGTPFPDVTEEMMITKIKSINPRYQISYDDSGIIQDVIVATITTS